MNRVAWLETKIGEASSLLAAGERTLAERPDDVIQRLSIGSLRSHVGELQHDLYLAKAERDKELITMRFAADHLNQGAIPLYMLARVSNYFERAMEFVSYRLQHGKEAKRMPEEMKRLLDLRLADVAFGSTELVITGNTRPDLVGDSLLENSLRFTFDLLSAQESELAERAAIAGAKASRMVGMLLREFERERCSVDFAWTDPADREHRWVANTARVTHVRSRLEQLSESPPETIVVDAAVELLSSTGRLVIRRNEGGGKISMRFPRDLYQSVQALHLGEHARFKILLNRLYNPNTQQDVQSYTLLAVNDKEAETPG